MTTQGKTFVGIVLMIIAVIIVVVVLRNMPEKTEPEPEPEPVAAVQMCFIWNTEAGDHSDMVMNIEGDKVSGEFNWEPAEKDSKTGPFTGVISEVDDMMMARTLSVLWEASAEGTTVTEELKIIMGEGTASPGFGEMKDRGDGVYVYADPENISYAPNLSMVGCGEEMIRMKKDVSTGITFRYPYILPSIYTSAVDWPPDLVTSKEAYSCTNAGIVTDRAGKTEQRTINGTSYCVTQKDEGTAGSTYSQYTYRTKRAAEVLTLAFSIRAVQCANYDESRKAECESERAAFTPDATVDAIVKSIAP